MSKITQENLRELYLKDLTLPDSYHLSHGNVRAKVRNLNPWKNIKSIIRTGKPQRIIDPYGPDNVWVWSDIHFGHGNIIKYSGRPYPTRQLMDACLIGNYQNIVKPNDICIFGGDIGFMKPHDINYILNQLPGYKIQIVGNHDLDRDGSLMELAFDETHLCLVVDADNPDFDVQLLFTHYPMDSVPEGTVNVHGHIHTNLANTWNLNMCVEHTNYQPKHIKDFIQRARKYVGAQKGFPT